MIMGFDNPPPQPSPAMHSSMLGIVETHEKKTSGATLNLRL
jgi:hypothetical protein